MGAEPSGERWQAWLRWNLVAANHLLLGFSIICAIIFPGAVKETLFQMGMAEKLPLFTKLTILIPWSAVPWGLAGLGFLLLLKEFIIKSNRVSIIWNTAQFCVMAFLLAFSLASMLLPFVRLSRF